MCLWLDTNIQLSGITLVRLYSRLQAISHIVIYCFMKCFSEFSYTLSFKVHQSIYAFDFSIKALILLGKIDCSEVAFVTNSIHNSLF